jgi:mono/diheme cytochrome c family protein
MTLKKAAVLVMPVLMMVLGIGAFGVRTRAEGAFDAAATYKSKCVACHGAKAEKKHDPAVSDDDSVQIILKGKKMAKPPHMPAYGEKGITEDQAKALLAHMKSLRQ